MEFRILGPIEVLRDGTRLPLGPKQRALLAILLMHRNQAIGADRLVELLWGEDSPETAQHSLQVHVSQLRKVLPANTLVSQPPGYLLHADDREVDAIQFEAAAAAAKQRLESGDLDQAVQGFRSALALWRGEPLADVASAPFALGEVARLNELRLRAFEECIDAELALGRHADQLPELEGLVAEYPLRERLRGQLMLALYRSGRQAEASEAFHKTRALLIDQLGMEPGPELQKLFVSILKQDKSLDIAVRTARPERRETHNLPLPLTSFVGRMQELLELRRLVSQNRLVTITGVGGVGKTRLAIQLAHHLVGGFSDGVWLTELAPIRDGGLVARTVASTLGLREQPDRTVQDVITSYLEGRQVLLFIDNCEHLIQAAAEMIDALLRKCPKVTILATSREALRVEGEVIWQLHPLAVPESDLAATSEAVAQSDAVRLFLERAAAVSAVPSKDKLRSVVEICHHLDGLPLGIELAAATLLTLPVEQLAANLDHRFRMLAAGSRTALRRQQTLEASIDWSYELLSEPERALFRRLAIFTGSFGVEHATAICSGAPVNLDETFGLLSNLVAKSLVTFDSSGPEGRYGLLETVHQYAQDRLAQTGEETALGNRHLDWYCSLAERASLAIHGPDQVKWFELLDNEYSNIRAALRWGSERRTEAMARLSRSLAFFWMVRGYFTEGRDWLRQALSISTSSSVRAQALTAAGMLACLQSDSSAVRALLGEARELLEGLDDPATKGMALKLLGWDYWSNGMTSEGLGLVEQAVAQGRRAGPTWGLASHLNDLGWFAHLSGDRSPRPRRLLEEALATARQINDIWVCALTLDSLAQVAADSGDLDTARRCWEECISIATQLRDRFSLPAFLQGFARLATLQGHYERAMCLLAAAARLVSETGAIWPQPEQERVERMVQAARQPLGDQAADAAWRRGHGMTMAEALSYATESQQPVATTPSYEPAVS